MTRSPASERPLPAAERRYLQPRRDLNLQVVDEAGNSIPARISVTDSRQRSYAPDEAWVHADDLIVRERQAVETRYFHSRGAAGSRCRSIGWPSPSATVPPTRLRTSKKTRAPPAGRARER